MFHKRGSRWAVTIWVPLALAACGLTDPTDPSVGVPLPLPAPATPEPKAACAEGAEALAVGNGQFGCDMGPTNSWRIIWPGSDGLEEEKFRAACDEMGGTLLWLTTTDPIGQFECLGAPGTGDI